MKTTIWVATLIALAFPAVPALASPMQQSETAQQEEASIPFPNKGGIRDWEGVDDSTIYIQARNRDWYKATLMMPSPELNFVNAIGFKTRGPDRFDRFSSVVIAGQTYALKSLVKVKEPPVGDPEEQIPEEQ